MGLRWPQGYQGDTSIYSSSRERTRRVNGGLCCGICRRKKLKKAEYGDRWLVGLLFQGLSCLESTWPWGEHAARGRSLRGWESQEEGLTGVCWPCTLKNCSHGWLVSLGNRRPFPFKPRCSITAYEHGKQSQKLTEDIGPNHASLIYTRSCQVVAVTR